MYTSLSKDLHAAGLCAKSFEGIICGNGCGEIEKSWLDAFSRWFRGPECLVPAVANARQCIFSITNDLGCHSALYHVDKQLLAKTLQGGI